MSKYHNKKTEFMGVMYDSKFEASIAMEIEALIRSGEIVEVIPNADEPKKNRYPLRGINGNIVGHYAPDFAIVRPDGSVEVWEAKGFVTDDFRLRRKIFEDNYPQIKYVVRRNAR